MRVDKELLNSALDEVGYKHIRQMVYMAVWSTLEVEHFLQFSTWGTPKDFFTAQFGLRNPDGEAFAVECINEYGGSPFRQLPLKHDPQIDFKMRFSLGKLAGWGPRWALYIPVMSMPSLAERVKADIRDRLYPIIRNVTTLDKLLALLVADDEPCRWMYVNGAIRAAQIAYLARRLGIRCSEIEAMLIPFSTSIAAQLGKGAVDPAIYIHSIVKRAGGNGASRIRF